MTDCLGDWDSSRLVAVEFPGLEGTDCPARTPAAKSNAENPQDSISRDIDHFPESTKTGVFRFTSSDCEFPGSPAGRNHSLTARDGMESTVSKSVCLYDFGEIPLKSPPPPANLVKPTE
jgi:hypothetical protein